MASNHSSCIGSISITNSWNLRVMTAITNLSRSSFAAALRLVTTSAEVSSVKKPFSCAAFMALTSRGSI